MRVAQVEPGLVDALVGDLLASMLPQMVEASAAVTSSLSPITLPTSRIAVRGR